MSQAIHILGVDPGFANIGLVVVKLKSNKEFVKHVEAFVTKKSPKKTRVLTTDDNLMRAKQIARRLRELDRKYRFRGIAAEAMSFPRNASAAAKMSLAWGVLADLSEGAGIPIIQARPQAIRAALGLQPKKAEGKDSAKNRTQVALRKRFKKFASLVERSGIPKGRWEHCYDALAAVVACLESPEIQWARSLNGERC